VVNRAAARSTSSPVIPACQETQRAAEPITIPTDFPACAAARGAAAPNNPAAAAASSAATAAGTRKRRTTADRAPVSG
jgi:hypothetical protein